MIKQIRDISRTYIGNGNNPSSFRIILPPLTISIAKVYNVIRPSFTYSNINMDKRAPGFARSVNSPSVLIPSLIQSACNCQREYATVEALDFN